MRWKPHAFKSAGKWWCVDGWGSLHILTDRDRSVFSPYTSQLGAAGLVPKIAARLGTKRQPSREQWPSPRMIPTRNLVW